ncbi:MAG: WYL domain-containing protein [Bacteroides sp.]|nr:WYL domain-containing protein [Bacteroides sp.]
MPSNKNALTRIVLLDKMLADRYHAYSIQDMTDYLERELPQYGKDGGVSKRCVEKDIEYLEYNFPIPIEFERYTIDAHSAATDRVYKKRCIRYSDPTFSIFKGKLSDEEKGILTTALSTIGSFDGLDGFGWLDDLNKRLGLVEQRPIVQISKNLLENKTLMAEAFSAIKVKAVVKLKYRMFNTSEIREVIISPYLLKEYNRRWYLIGSADDSGRILTFALDRLISIVILPGYEYREAPEDLTERYEDIIGVSYYEGAGIHKIIFWVSDKSAPYVDTKPLHGSQISIKGDKEKSLRELYEIPAGGSLFSIDCMENYELIRELCSYGEDLKVLSPRHIISAIKKRIKSMSKLYDT